MAESLKDGTSLAVLRQYYAKVMPLRAYLEEILGPATSSSFQSFVPCATDSAEYSSLIETSYVCMRVHAPQSPIQISHAMATMKEIIEVAQARIFRHRGQKDMLTAGYDKAKNYMGGTGVLANYYLNTIVTSLHAQHWDTLLHRVGADAMVHILSETSVFISFPNDCFCQMTGEPIIVLKPQKNSLPTPTNKVRLTPVQISLARHRIYYSRPSLKANNDHIMLGLSPRHVLNRLYYKLTSQSKSIAGGIDLNAEALADNARHLAKYVFPRRYGLTNVFVAKTGTSFSNRDVEILEKGSCKTPKRLREVLIDLEKIIWRHGKCKYKLLLDKSCRSKVAPKGQDRPDDSIILEMMSEQSIISQAHMSSTGPTNSVPGTLRSVSTGKYQKPRFAEYACSHFEVHSFVVLVSRSVFPTSIWGCKRNFVSTMNHVKTFISGRRFETMTLHSIVQDFSTAACTWLMPPGSGQKQQRVSVSDALMRRELLEDFIFWFFDSFIVSLLETTFYITDSSAFRKQTLYFRQDDWKDLCDPLIRRLSEETFQKMTETEANEILRQRRLGFAYVRLLPKETGVRPIVNLKRKNTAQTGTGRGADLSINQILQTAFSILTYEKQARPDLVGVSVFSPDDVYSKLKAFKTRVLQYNPSQRLPQLYFVKVDVQACFDTIDQTKLLEILHSIISEDTYILQRYGQINSVAERLVTHRCKKAIPEDDHTHFLELASELAKFLRHTVFVDQVIYPRAKRQAILDLLEEHVTENIVKIGSDYYRQMVGIPQGSVLSTILCSFFYGDLEKRYHSFTQDDSCALLRMVDDYLFITTERNLAKDFLGMMNRGHPDYGCLISKDKTLTNFDYDEQIMNVTGPQQDQFPWCGYNISMLDLSVSVDYTRYSAIPLKHTLTVARGGRPGAAFIAKMLFNVKARSHVIYSDEGLNNRHTIHLNIYQHFLLSAMKMHSYIVACGLKLSKRPDFLKSTIDQMILYCYTFIRSKAHSKAAKLNHAIIRIAKWDVVWLGTHAFHTVLSRKADRYRALLKRLRFTLHHHRYSRCSKKFRVLVQTALRGLGEIPY